MTNCDVYWDIREAIIGDVGKTVDSVISSAVIVESGRAINGSSVGLIHEDVYNVVTTVVGATFDEVIEGASMINSGVYSDISVAVSWAVYRAVDEAGYRAVSGAVYRAVYEAVDEAVSGAVSGAVYEAVREAVKESAHD